MFFSTCPTKHRPYPYFSPPLFFFFHFPTLFHLTLCLPTYFQQLPRPKLPLRNTMFPTKKTIRQNHFKLPKTIHNHTSLRNEYLHVALSFLGNNLPPPMHLSLWGSQLLHYFILNLPFKRNYVSPKELCALARERKLLVDRNGFTHIPAWSLFQNFHGFQSLIFHQRFHYHTSMIFITKFAFLEHH